MHLPNRFKSDFTTRKRTSKGEIMKNKLVLLVLLAVMALPSLSFAAPKVTLEVIAEKMQIVEKDGKDVQTWVKSSAIKPGEVVMYTIKYKNDGDEPAVDSVIEDPIPNGTYYITDSAEGKDAEITFSADGKSFTKPSLLTYQVKGPGGKMEKRSVSPENYSHIRWVVKHIAPGQKGSVSFKVKVK